MTTAHTPGDWRVWAWTQCDVDGAIDACGHQVVSRLPDGSEVGIFTTATEGESPADLHLIAAAPDMLQALVNARDIIATDRQGFVDCNVVHGARAEDPIAHSLVLVTKDEWVTSEDSEVVRDYDRALALIDAAMTKATGGAS